MVIFLWIWPISLRVCYLNTSVHRKNAAVKNSTWMCSLQSNSSLEWGVSLELSKDLFSVAVFSQLYFLGILVKFWGFSQLGNSYSQFYWCLVWHYYESVIWRLTCEHQELCILNLLIFTSGNVAWRFRCGKNMCSCQIQRWSFPLRLIYFNRRNRLQGETLKILNGTISSMFSPSWIGNFHEEFINRVFVCTYVA